MGQGVTVSSTKSTIINNWIELNQNSEILFNKITNEQIQRHSYTINQKSELLSYSKRMQDHSSNICRIIYFCPKNNSQSNVSIKSYESSSLRAKSSTSTNDKQKMDTQNNSIQMKRQYLIFTDRMIPIKQWTREKIINIIKALKKLISLYGCFRIKEKCLCENERKQIKIWINQNPVQNNLIQQVDAEQDMIADLAAVLVSKKQKFATELIGVTAFDEVIQKLSRNIQKTYLQVDHINQADVKKSLILNKDKKGKPVQVNNYYNVFINTDNNYATGHSLQNSNYNPINTNSSYIQPKQNQNFKPIQPTNVANQTNLFINKKKVEFSNNFNRAIITSSKEKVQRIQQQEYSPTRKLKTQNIAVTDPSKYKTEYPYTKRTFDPNSYQQAQVKPKSKLNNFLTVNQQDQQKKFNSSVPKFIKAGQFSKQKYNSSGQILKNIKMVGFGQKLQIINKDFELVKNSAKPKSNIKNYNQPIFPFKQQVNFLQNNNLSKYTSTVGKNIMASNKKSQESENVIFKEVDSCQLKKVNFQNAHNHNHKHQSRRESDISDFSEHNSISNNSATGSLNQNANHHHVPYYIKNHIKDPNGGNVYSNFNKQKIVQNQIPSKSKAKNDELYKKYEAFQQNGTHKSFIGYTNNFKSISSKKSQQNNKIIEQKKQKANGFYEPFKATSNYKQGGIKNISQINPPAFLQQRKKFPSTYAVKNPPMTENQNQKNFQKKQLFFQKTSLKSQNSGQIKVQNHYLQKPVIKSNYLKQSSNSYNMQAIEKKEKQQQTLISTKNDNYKNYSYFNLQHKKIGLEVQKNNFQPQDEGIDETRNLSYPYVPERKYDKHFTFQQIQSQNHQKNQNKLVTQHCPAQISQSTEPNKYSLSSNKMNMQRAKVSPSSKNDSDSDFVFHRTTSGDVQIDNNCSIVNQIQKEDRGGINRSDPGQKVETSKLFVPWKEMNKVNTYGSLIHDKYIKQPSKIQGKGLTSNYSGKKETESKKNDLISQKAQYIQPDPLIKKSLKKQIQMECVDLFGDQILKRPDQVQEQVERKEVQNKKVTRMQRRSSSPIPISSQSIDIKDVDDRNDDTSSLLNNVSSKDLLIKQKVQKKKAKYAQLKSQFSDLFG